MRNVRVFFSKKGEAIFISHLDLMRSVTRALKRAGIPIWYTQGFNPHPYITFALPLSLGYEGYRESLELRLEGDMSIADAGKKLAETMPPGIEVLEVVEQASSPLPILFADYRIVVRCADGDFIASFEEFWSGQDIVVTKKTKRGTKEIDIKPDIQILALKTMDNANEIELTLKMSAGNTKNINPALLIEAYQGACQTPVEIISVARTGLYNEGMAPFGSDLEGERWIHKKQ